MSRYYRIELSTQDGKPISPSSLAGSGMPPGVITSLLSDGARTNPAALNIEMDLPIYAAGLGDISAYVRIWGLSLRDISRAFDLNLQKIKIFGGMAKGYPLADPTQQGLLIQGDIRQAFGNWVGTDMTLDMFVQPGNSATPDTPGNFASTWTQGEKLSAMIARTLSVAMPSVKQDIKIDDSRVSKSTESHTATTLTQFSQYIQSITLHGLGDSDEGVTIVNNGQTVRAYESKPQVDATVKQIRFQDLLGQVTWAEPLVITAKLVLRGDLHVLDTIQFPPNLISTVTGSSASAFGATSRAQNSLSFDGKFKITQIHHWGNYRQADAMSWNTTIWATGPI